MIVLSQKSGMVLTCALLITLCFHGTAFGNSSTTDFSLRLLVLASQDTIPEPPLKNAYDIAKAIVKHKKELSNPGPGSAEFRKRLFQHLLWYADVQDEQSERQVYELIDKLKKYTSLRERVKHLLDIDLIGSLDYLIENKTDVINRKLIPDSVSQQFEKHVDKILSTESLLKKSNETLSAKIDQKKLLQNELLSAVKRIDSASQLYFRQLININTDSTKDIDSSTSARLAASAAKIDSASFARQLNAIHLYTDSQRIKEIEIGINQARNELDSFVKTNHNAFLPLYYDLIDLNIEKPGFSAATKLADEAQEVWDEKKAINIYLQREEATRPLQLTGLPTQSELIDAMAIYLAKRVKQEAAMYFFETIKKNAKRHDLITTFFPSTINLLQSKEAYDIPNLGTQWRYALSKDFVKIPANVLKCDWVRDRLPGNKRSYIPYLDATIQLAELVIQRHSYRDIVKKMYLSSSDKQDVTIKGIFSLLYAVNNELYEIVDDTTFRMLGYEDFRRMNAEELEIMASLINLKYNNCIETVAKGSFANFRIGKENAEAIRSWLGGIEQAVAQIDRVRKQFIHLQEQVEKEATKDVLFNTYNIWSFISELMEVVVPYNLSGLDATHVKIMQKAGTYIRNTQEIYSQLSDKNFAGAVNSTIGLLEEILYNDAEFSMGTLIKDKHITKISLEKAITWNRSGALQKIFYLLNGKDSIAAKELGLRLVGTGDTLQLVFDRNSRFAAVYFEDERHAIVMLRQLSGFLNDVIRSDDSRQLARVVESYAMPPGSYKRKRSNWWSLDLNAFVGLYGGYEWTEKINDFSSKGGVYGISAPIGLTLSKTFGRRERGNNIQDDRINNPDLLKLNRNNIYRRSKSTLSITGSIVDIGAVVAFRFNNTTDSVLPQQVKWSQIISPGLHLAYGLGSTPLVLKTGFQFTPELRRLGEQNAKDLQRDAYRLYLGIFFDIPLFNLWERRSIVYGPYEKRSKNIAAK